jgi:hypothetical protein
LGFTLDFSALLFLNIYAIPGLGLIFSVINLRQIKHRGEIGCGFAILRKALSLLRITWLVLETL